jgi:hypothetical protein
MNHPSPSSCETRVSRPYQIITLMLHSLPPHWLCCCGCCISITVDTKNKANVRPRLQNSRQQELYSKIGNFIIFHNVATIVYCIVISIKFYLLYKLSIQKLKEHQYRNHLCFVTLIHPQGMAKPKQA